MAKFLNEFQYFRRQPHNMKVLLITNLCFAFVLPVIEIFVGAYIMRNTNNPSFVAVYQLAQYTGIVLSSLINGFLLKRINVRTLYMFGILVSGISLLVMMTVQAVGLWELVLSGLLLGVSVGFFWTNRYLLALNSTTDDNRNYFYGLESFFFSVCSILVPLAVGGFLAKASGTGFFGSTMDINKAYQIVTFVTLGICILACIALSRGKFTNPAQKKFLYLKFNRLWKKMIGLAALKGLIQGFLVTAPAILILRLVGSEGELGLIQGIGGLITAVIVYVLGRVTKPKDRIVVFAVGIVIFFIGTLVNAALFSAVGVIVFVLCKIFFQPLHDLAYNPIQLRTIDVVSHQEHRNEYAYIMNHELGLYAGRAIGLVLFIVLATYVSEDFALKFALVIVGAVELLSIPLAKNITKNTDKAPKYAAPDVQGS